MRRTRRSRRPRLTIVLAILASITLITLDYKGNAHGTIRSLQHIAHDAFSPVQRAVEAVTRPIGSFLAGAVNAGAIEQQNAQLRRELGQIERKQLSQHAQAQMLAALAQLEHLPWAAGVPQLDSIPDVAAEVVALNSSDFAATIQLDVGRRNGVDVGMPVVGGAGLVGQVVDSWSSGCTVRLITDSHSQVGVRFADPAGEALIGGQGPGGALNVSYVAPGTALHKGQVFTTAGLQGGLFPPGIPVAQVSSFSSTPSATEETVTARPVVDIGDLEFVDVLEWEPSP
ncbi:MAG: rod shape-determining protein MreC [Acidimicrobiales bacterium]